MRAGAGEARRATEAPSKESAAVARVDHRPNWGSELGCVQRGPRLVGEGAKRLRIAHGEVGQNLPINLDAGLAQSADQRVVAHVVLASRGVDADDPESAEIALLVLAIAVRIAPPALDGLLRGLP